ncbi:IS66-like element accessory protein TnpA [Paraburkholderia tropica]|uniref:IS66-like element accessory protein TnpA n=1 Tax=Paraburkholderia tropica TaxID=92647 RepID=UPI001610B786|nr:transposase [Paraburkholderia tropica]MBB2984559.1 transposase [Paraburkholderia tropica]
MSQDDANFLPLRVTHIGVRGKRSFDPTDKRRLIEACLQPGPTLSGLALKAGVNADQLRKWVRLYQQSNAPLERDVAVVSPAFVPVVAIDDSTRVPTLVPATRLASEKKPVRSSRAATSVRVAAQLPNGVQLEFECTAGDTGLLTALVAALRAR